MTKNYFKGQVNYIRVEEGKTYFVGKILPAWAKPGDESQQLSFTQYSLTHNPQRPEESGACIINFHDTFCWRYAVKGNVTHYMPKDPSNPFVVYFKIKENTDKQGKLHLVAVSIVSPNNISAEEKEIADLITKQPPLSTLLNGGKMNFVDAYNYATPTTGSRNKKIKDNLIKEEIEEDDDDSIGSQLEAEMCAEWASETYKTPYKSQGTVHLTVTNEAEIEEIENRKEEDAIEEDDDENCGYRVHHSGPIHKVSRDFKKAREN